MRKAQDGFGYEYDHVVYAKNFRKQRDVYTVVGKTATINECITAMNALFPQDRK